MAVSILSVAAEAADAINPADLSIQHLVTQADPVVKAVLVILVLFSVWCWTVMFEKLFAFTAAFGAARRLESTLENGTLEDIINYSDKHPVA